MFVVLNNLTFKIRKLDFFTFYFAFRILIYGYDYGRVQFLFIYAKLNATFVHVMLIFSQANSNLLLDCTKMQVCYLVQKYVFNFNTSSNYAFYSLNSLLVQRFIH